MRESNWATGSQYPTFLVLSLTWRGRLPTLLMLVWTLHNATVGVWSGVVL
jgi:hypothetical protein